MKCNKCGYVNEEEQEYCVQCREKLNEEEVSLEELVENESETDPQNIQAEEAELVSEAPAKLADAEGSVTNTSKSKSLKAAAIVMALLIIGTLAAVGIGKTALAKGNDTSKSKTATAAAATGKTETKGTKAAANTVSKDQVVVTLDKEKITEPIFRLYFYITQQRFETTGPNVWEMESNGKKTIDIAKENTLSEIKMSVAAKKKAQELGIKITDEEKKSIYDQANDILTNNVEVMSKLNTEIKDMEEFITQGLFVQKVMENIAAGYTPTEAELKTQIEQVKATYETATAKHVLIGIKDESGQALSADKIKEKKKLAEEVLKKALAGEDMAALAKTYSEDPGSKDKGGEYTFPKGQMVPAFEEASFTGEIGKVYPKLVETDYGYHIIKVEKRETGDMAQIKKDSEQAIKSQYAQAELLKLSEKISAKTTDLYNTIGIIK